MKLKGHFKIFSKEEIKLISRCYDNEFGVDLKWMQISLSLESAGDQQSKLDKINKSGRCKLEDGISSRFELVRYKGLFYLLGDNSCYPCSPVVESAYGEDQNFVMCWILNSKEKIIGATDIKDSAIIISMFSDVVKAISDEQNFLSYIDYVERIFSKNSWFSPLRELEGLFRFVKFWNYKEKINKLYEHGYLYPIPLILYTLYNRKDLKSSQLFRCFYRSLAESSKEIFSKLELKNYIDSIPIQEWEHAFEIDYINENVKVEMMDDDYMADLLLIDVPKRYAQYRDFYGQALERRESLFVNSSFKAMYSAMLKENFQYFENQLRKDKGYGEIGSYYREQLLFERVKENFPNLTIISQYSPVWLSPQRFDIFIKECNIAVEYNGAQHYEAIDFFGGKEGLKNIRALDKLKRKKSKENAVEVTIVRYDHDFEKSLKKLKNKIQKKYPKNRS